MTDRIKTMEATRLILLKCKEAPRSARLIAEVLQQCGYRACGADCTEETDYVITDRFEPETLPEWLIPDTAAFDRSHADVAVDGRFRMTVADYAALDSEQDDDDPRLFTYSADHYAADLTCRNVQTRYDGMLVFDIVSGGILSRVRTAAGRYTVDEILFCTAVLAAAGVPLASVLGYLNQ